MNKPIIIDGVDVAECKHFEDADCFNPAETVLSCEAQPNCLFKQLQRMKKEYEFLYNEYNRYSSICTELNCQISDLTKVLISLFRLLVCDYDKFKGQILSKTDIDYIEKRKQSINKCLKVFNEVLEDVH